MIALLLGLGAPAGFALLHGALAHAGLFRKWPPQKLAVLVCALGAGLEWWIWTATVEDSAIFALFLSAATAHVYFHFFNMSETARRIRHLVARHRGAEIAAEAGSSSKARLRLERLVALGEVERDGTRFTSRPGPLTWAARLLVAYERCLFPKRYRIPFGD